MLLVWKCPSIFQKSARIVKISRISELFIVDGTWIYKFEPQRRANNKQWLCKVQARQDWLQRQSHQSKTGYKYTIWHIDEKSFNDWSQSKARPTCKITKSAGKSFKCLNFEFWLAHCSILIAKARKATGKIYKKNVLTKNGRKTWEKQKCSWS